MAYIGPLQLIAIISWYEAITLLGAGGPLFASVSPFPLSVSVGRNEGALAIVRIGVLVLD